LAEVRAYSKPPGGVDGVLQAVMIIMGKEATWASAKKEMTAPDFLQQLKKVDKDHIMNKTLVRIEKITSDPEMMP
jgi:dynein heavy chain